MSALARRVLLVAALLLAPRVAGAQEEESGGGTRLYLRLAAYFPADAEVRRAFGDVIPWPGIALVPAISPGRTRVYPRLELFGARSSSSHFVVVPLTIAVEHQWHGTNGHFVPFAGVGAGVGYFDYKLHRNGQVMSTSRGGTLGDAEVGIVVSRALRLGAKYRLMQEMDGVTFGGSELGVVVGGFRVF